MVYIWGLVLNCLYLNNIWPVLCVKQDCYSMNGLSRSWAQWSLDLFPAVGPLLLGFTVCAALPPAATDWIQWRRGGRDETWKCVCVCGCKGDLNTRCGLECLHTLKHKDESDEEKGGGGCIDSQEVEVWFYTYQRLPIPTLDLPWCVCMCVCVSAPSKPSIDTQLSTVLIQNLGRGSSCITASTGLLQQILL